MVSKMCCPVLSFMFLTSSVFDVLERHCKTLNICSIEILRFDENDKFAKIEIGIHDIPCLQRINKL